MGKKIEDGGQKYYLKKGTKVRVNIPDYDLKSNPMLSPLNGLKFTVRRVHRYVRPEGGWLGDLYVLQHSDGTPVTSNKGKPYFFLRGWLEKVNENGMAKEV